MPLRPDDDGSTKGSAGSGGKEKEENRMKGVHLLLVSIFVAFLVACIPAAIAEETAPAKESPPVESHGPTAIVYRIAGWDRDRVEKAFGKPTKIAKKKEDFEKSINRPDMNDFLDNELEQWVLVPKGGMERTIITFDGNGKAVRAICEWSDY